MAKSTLAPNTVFYLRTLQASYALLAFIEGKRIAFVWKQMKLLILKLHQNISNVTSVQ